MRVAPDVVKDLAGPGQRWFGVDDPLGVTQGGERARPAAPVAERGERSVETQRARVVGKLEGLQKEATEEPRENPHRQEEARPTGDPSRPIRRQATTGNDTVQMGMMEERLSPGVEHGEEADCRAEVARIGGDGVEGGRSSANRLHRSCRPQRGTIEVRPCWELSGQ